MNLGITEYWSGRLAEAEPHLEHGITLARKIGRPYLEFLGLAHRTSIASVRSSPYALAEERARQTIELARRHGWTDEPAVGIAYISLAAGGSGGGSLRRRRIGCGAPSAPSGRKPSP